MVQEPSQVKQLSQIHVCKIGLKQGHFNTSAILYTLICRSPLPHPAFLLAGAAANYGSICGHVFVRWRERGGPGITSLYVGWQRTPRILVLVILMPHM